MRLCVHLCSVDAYSFQGGIKCPKQLGHLAELLELQKCNTPNTTKTPKSQCRGVSKSLSKELD